MKSIFTCMFVTLSCLAMSLLSFAYKPFYGKKIPKSKGLLKTLSGLFYCSTPPLNMQAQFPSDGIERNTAPLSFLRNFFTNRKKIVSKVEKKTPEAIEVNKLNNDLHSSSNIFKEDLGPHLSSYSTRSVNYGHSYVPGFMDFDPKFAARSAHRVHRGGLKRGESSWFNL